MEFLESKPAMLHSHRDSSPLKKSLALNTRSNTSPRDKDRVAGVYGRRIQLARNAFLLFLFLSAGLWCVVEFETNGTSCTAVESTSNAHVYLVVQMLFANGDAPCTSGPILQWLRLVAPWILPLLGLYAVVSSLRVRLSFFWKSAFYRHRDLVLVIGLGQKGMEMVRAECSRQPEEWWPKRTDVVVIEPDEDNPRIVQAESEGAQVWIGDGRSSTDLKTVAWKRPARIWIMTGDSRRNLLILDMVRKVFEKARESRIDVHALVSEFQERRDAMRLKTLNQDRNDCWTHIFNQEEAFAEWLIRKNPVRPINTQPPRILLVGLGPLGRAIHRELLLMCHYPDARELEPDRMPEIVMVDSADVFKVLEAELPFLREANSIAGVTPFAREEHLHEDAQAWVFKHYRDNVRKGSAFTHVFICMGSEVRNLALAERILGWEKLLLAPEPRIVPIVYDDEAVAWSDLGVGEESAGLIHPFKVSSIYTQEALDWRNKILHKMAKRIHLVYNLTGEHLNRSDKSSVWIERVKAISEEGKLLREQLMQQDLVSTKQDDEWQKLYEDNRRSSLAQARYLFNRFGCEEVDVESTPLASWRSTPTEPTAKGVERLDLEARCEHRRWIAFMLVENFGGVPIQDPASDFQTWRERCDEKFPNDKGSKLRDFARVNPNLVPFDDLQDKFKCIDLLFVAVQDWIVEGNAAR